MTRTLAIVLAAAFLCAPSAPAAEVTTRWTMPTSGDWFGGFWDNGTPRNILGGNDYVAIIDAVGSPYTVNVGPFQPLVVRINQLVLASPGATVALKHNTTFEAVNGMTLSAGQFLVDGGTLRNTAVTPLGGSLTFGRSDTNVLSNVHIVGDLSLADGSVTLKDGSGFSGKAIVGNGGISSYRSRLHLDGALSGGTVELRNGEFTTAPGSMIESGVRVHGYGQLGLDGIAIRGSVSGDVPGQTILVRGEQLRNEGLLEATGGATLRMGYDFDRMIWTNAQTGTLRATNATMRLNGNWSNEGTIDLVNSDLYLSGRFDLAATSVIHRTNSTIHLTEQIDNTGKTLSLNSNTGSWVLDRGWITGGEITTSDGVALKAQDGGIFGTRFTGDLDVTSGTFNMSAGANFSGTATVGSKPADHASHFYMQNATFGANATVNLRGGDLLQLDSAFALEAGVQVRGFGTLYAKNLLNRGTIADDQPVSAPFAALFVQTSSFVNEGVVEALNGGEVRISAEDGWSNGPGGVLRAQNGSLWLIGDWQNNGTIDIVDSDLYLAGEFAPANLGTIHRSGGRVLVAGQFDNSNHVLALDGTTGGWTIARGTITGGQVTQSDGAILAFDNSILNTLDGVQVVGDLNVASGRVRLQNGASYTGTAYVGNGSLGVLALGGTFDNAPIRLQAGHVVAEGTLTLGPNVQIRGYGGISSDIQTTTIGVVNEGSILVDQPATVLTVQVPNFTNRGTLNTVPGAYVDVNVTSFVNQGQFRAGAGGGLFITAASYVQTAGHTDLGAIGIVTAPVFRIEGGTLSGSGLIDTSLVNNGLLAPGSSAGALAITNNLTLQAASVLAIELGGTTQGGQYDFLEVGGFAQLGGLLDVQFIGGFERRIRPTDTFTILSAGGLGGAFQNVANGGRVATPFGSFQVNYSGSSLVLRDFTPVPEPSSVLLALAGAVALLAARRSSPAA